jgi:hypothetical protein
MAGISNKVVHEGAQVVINVYMRSSIAPEDHIKGTVESADEMGLVVLKGTNRLVFLPWSSIRQVEPEAK